MTEGAICGLTDETAISFLALQHNPVDQGVIDYLHGRYEEDDEFLPLVEVLTFRGELTYKENIKVLESDSLQELVKDALQQAYYFETLKAKQAAKRNALIILLSYLEKYFQLKSLKEITLKVWVSIVSQLKNDDTSYRDQLPDRFVNATRILAKTLAKLHNNDQYISVISIKRSDYHFGKLVNGYENWFSFFEEWRDGLLLKSTKERNASFTKLLGYLQTIENSNDPLVFITSERNYTFWKYLVDNDVNNKRATALQMNDFVNWIIEGHLIEEDEEDIGTSIGFPLLTAKEINLVIGSKYDNKPKPSESVKQAMPTKWLMLCKEILTEDDYAWPKSLDKEYVNRVNPETSRVERVWCPVSTYLYLFMCELPVRRIQVKSLDSGEGDNQIYSQEEKKWVTNTSPLAGYWKQLGSKVTERGIIRKIYSQGKESVGIYINTNKTQDRTQGFSETSGYEIPWHNESIIKYSYELLAWQQKYNPVNAPKKYKDIPKNVWSTRPTELVKEIIPDRFYLFRSPLNTSVDSPSADWLLNRYWLALMDELERRLKEQGEDVMVISDREKNGVPKASIFTPHGLRVTGLTAFVENGVPIEILSKVVAGHASILMTLYYIKHTPAYVSEILTSAQKSIEDNQQADFVNWLKSSAWADVQEYSIFNDKQTAKKVFEQGVRALWESNQLGLCPNAGTLCNIGGELLSKAGKEVYGEVSGGAGNCVRCRFFISGKPWLIPLWLHGNKLLADSQKISIDVEAARAELEALYNKRKSIAKEKGPAFITSGLKAEIKSAEALLSRKTEVLDQKLCDAHATYRLIEGIRYLDNTNFDRCEAEKYIPIRHVDSPEETKFFEQNKFRQQDMLVQASRLYAHIRDNDLERERNHFIDKIMLNAGMKPITMGTLTEEEVESASDALASYLAYKFSDQELSQLGANTITLKQLGVKISSTEQFISMAEAHTKSLENNEEE
ncbi:MAG: VPA1269 family protein [Aestuariibacter sp.]